MVRRTLEHDHPLVQQSGQCLAELVLVSHRPLHIAANDPRRDKHTVVIGEEITPSNRKGAFRVR
jgi:hypothetical protein